MDAVDTNLNPMRDIFSVNSLLMSSKYNQKATIVTCNFPHLYFPYLFLVADQVYGDQEMHTEVRRHCMDYMVWFNSRP